MKSRALMTILVLGLALSACNLPSNVSTPTPTLELITPSPIPPPPSSTPTGVPSNTPAPTATSTPTIPVAFPKDQAVNCRVGPGTEWLQLSGLSVGISSQIVGKSAEGGWWYIVDPFNASRKCWVSVGVTNTAGNLTTIPIVEAPKATVTDVTIDAEPNIINASACPGAGNIEFSGSIETNGPTRVTWHFETQQSGALPTNTTDFDTFGSIEFSTSYTPLLGAGTYWVRLIVTDPNQMQAEMKYTITCP